MKTLLFTSIALEVEKKIVLSAPLADVLSKDFHTPSIFGHTFTFACVHGVHADTTCPPSVKCCAHVEQISLILSGVQLSPAGQTITQMLQERHLFNSSPNSASILTTTVEIPPRIPSFSRTDAHSGAAYPAGPSFTGRVFLDSFQILFSVPERLFHIERQRQNSALFMLLYSLRLADKFCSCSATLVRDPQNWFECRLIEAYCTLSIKSDFRCQI